MKTTRRNFLKAIVATAALTTGLARTVLAVKDRMIERIVLMGDGVHDDTEALQAMVDGYTVFSEVEQREIIGYKDSGDSTRTVRVPAGTNKITKTLSLRNSINISGKGTNFVAENMTDSMVRITGDDVTIEKLAFDANNTTAISVNKAKKLILNELYIENRFSGIVIKEPHKLSFS